MLLVSLKYLLVLVAGGAGGFLYGGKVEAAAQAKAQAAKAAGVAIKQVL